MSWETHVPPLEDAPPSPDAERFGASVAWGIFCACTLLQLGVIAANRPGDRFGALLAMDLLMIVLGPAATFVLAPFLPPESLRAFARNATRAALLMLALMVLMDAAALPSADFLPGR